MSNWVQQIKNKFMRSKLPLVFNLSHKSIALLLVLSIFLVFLPYIISGEVLSSIRADIANQFLAWRQFGFSELSKGHFPLWNPYVYSGAPYFSGFQSALLYPLNVIYLIFATPIGINISLILHTLLLALFTQFWMAKKGFHPVACGLSGFLAAMGGAFIPHIYAGHLSNINTMVWAPLIFCVIDSLTGNIKTTEKSKIRYLLIGAFAVGMQVLAGHPQYVIYTIISSAVYLAAQTLLKQISLKSIIWVFFMFAFGFLLSFAQLFLAVITFSETLRSTELGYEFISMFSFPPENVLTMVTPNFFGTLANYWGRCYLWETSIFVGIGALVFIFKGFLSLEKKQSLAILLTLTVLIFVSLGKHTGALEFLYNYIPGFSNFRATTKIMFFVHIFLCYLFCAGINQLISENFITTHFIKALIFFGFFFVLVSLTVSNMNWATVTDFISSTGESYKNVSFFQNPVNVFVLQEQSFKQLFMVAIKFFILSAIAFFSRKKIVLRSLFLAFIFVELSLFGFESLTTFKISDVKIPNYEQIKSELSSNRVLNLTYPNYGSLTETRDLWGNDPLILTRYAEFMKWTQTGDFNNPNQYISFNKPHALYNMLRLKYVLWRETETKYNFTEIKDPLPEAFLVGSFQLGLNRNDVFRLLSNENFNPKNMAILESPPKIPISSADGVVKIINKNTDSLELEVTINENGILVLTENYSKHWKVKGLKESFSNQYEITPVNYILKAVVLSKGQHHLKIYYQPDFWILSLAIMGLSWLLFVFTYIKFRP